jgi:hypothetical protein
VHNLAILMQLPHALRDFQQKPDHLLFDWKGKGPIGSHSSGAFGCRCAFASRPNACASPLLVKVLQGTRLFLEHLHHKLPWQVTGVLSDCVSSTLKISACPLQSFHQPPTCHQYHERIEAAIARFSEEYERGFHNQILLFAPRY